MTDDNNKVVKLRQPTRNSVAGVGVDDPINPKSFLNMTEVEQDMFLQALRERRMRAVEIVKRAIADRAQASTVAMALRMEKKHIQAQRQLDKVNKALDKLDEIIYSMRALHLQYTDTDITKVT
jgi:hypothetical protein